MKVNIIGTAGLPPKYGGFETLADNLVKSASSTVFYTVFCAGNNFATKPKKYQSARLRYVFLPPNGMASIFYDGLSMLLSLRSDIVLILGVSGAFFLPLFRLLYRGKIIVNMDGLEWKRSKWSYLARKYLRMSESIAVRFADTLIADNQAIVDYVKSTYRIDAKLIEYGANCIISDGFYSPIIIPFGRKTYAIVVCRIEPENHTHLILNAFAEFGLLPVVVVGNWQNSIYGKKLYNKYNGKWSSVLLLDPIYDSDTVNTLRSGAMLYVHGHSAGGTNPSLVEAMSLSLPVLAFDCVYNRTTTENKCWYFRNENDLITKLKYVITNKPELLDVGSRMAEIAIRRYNWKIITDKYQDLYFAGTKWSTP